tara:strand:+ start:201 stop:554 length:354 start_codon:yes stop_codon:yes gene_type:complete
MEDYIAIVKTSNNKVDKYQDFSNKSDADAHVATHGGFVVDNPGGDISYWIVNASEKSVTFDKSTSDADVAKAAAVAYKKKRRNEYPSYADQFDLIYHSGIDAWKAKIKETKVKFPKS